MKNYNIEKDVFDWLKAAGFHRSETAMQKTAIEGFWSEIGETFLAYQQNDKSEVLDGLVDSTWMYLNMAYFKVDSRICHFANSELYRVEQFGIADAISFSRAELQRYQKAVSISNWSKFCESEAEAQQTCIAYANGMHPDKLGKTIMANYKLTGSGRWTVYQEHTLKVLKSINYKPVQEVLKMM